MSIYGCAEFSSHENQSLITEIALPYGITTGEYSVSCWWKPDTLLSQGTVLFGTGAGGGGSGLERPGQLFVSLLGGVRKVLFAPDQNTAFDVTSDAALAAGVWHFIVFTRDNAGLCKLYIDGTLQAITSTTSYSLPEKKALLGQYPNGLGNVADGRMTDLAVAYREWSAADITAMWTNKWMADNDGAPGFLAAYWKMNNTFGVITNGDTGLLNHGLTGVGLTTGRFITSNGSPVWVADSPFPSDDMRARSLPRPSDFRPSRQRPNLLVDMRRPRRKVPNG